MIIGLMSDSHGRHLAVRRALKLFTELSAEAVIHCGDVGGQGVFDELAGWRCWFVWGNTDVPDAPLRTYLDAVDLPWPESVPLLLTLAGKRIAVWHGHERGFHHPPADDVDYVLYGHTHQRADQRVGGVRYINPGALHRASPKTVATLDLVADLLVYHEIRDSD